MKLTAIQVKKAKPKDKPYKLADGKGLYLLVNPNGRKYWRVNYRFEGKGKTASLGTYPDSSLADARIKLIDIRHTLFNDEVDPMEKKKREKALKLRNNSNTFKAVAGDWIANNDLWTESHRKRVESSLLKEVFPHIGDKPIHEIEPPEILAVIRRVESRDALDVASRVLQRCTAVFQYAVQTGKTTTNPARELKGALKTRKTRHVPSIPPAELPDLLQAIDGYIGNPITKYALKFLMLTFVRPGELRFASWEEIDFDTALWRIPAARMKMNSEHIVPLSHQSIQVLRQIHELTADCAVIFRGERTKLKPISENTMNVALHRLGYKNRATTHGFRATASSILNEQGFTPDAIERQLSHIERNNVRAAYTHHARFLDERRSMMQWWADHLDQLTLNCDSLRFRD